MMMLIYGLEMGVMQPQANRQPSNTSFLRPHVWWLPHPLWLKNTPFRWSQCLIGFISSPNRWHKWSFGGRRRRGSQGNMHRIVSLFYPSIPLKMSPLSPSPFFFFTFISLYFIFPFFPHSPGGVAGNFPCCEPHRSPRLARIQADQWWRRQRSTGGGAPRPIASTECIPFRWCVGTAGKTWGGKWCSITSRHSCAGCGGSLKAASL